MMLRRADPKGPHARYLLWLTATLVVSSACTHTKQIVPAGPTRTWAAAQTSLEGRQARIFTLDDRSIVVRLGALTPAMAAGTTVPEGEWFTASLSEVRSVEYTSRGRGAWDWLMIGTAVNTAGMLAIMQDAGSDPEWGLFPLVVGVATIPYVLFGAIWGSTIRFEIVPGG